MNTPVKTWVGSVIIIIVAVVVGGFIFLYGSNCAKNISTDVSPINKKNIQRACTEEAKICPDGSYVGRTGANCEFTPCPEIVGIEDKIIIAAPAKNSTISSPVVVSGRARGTWFFEGSFPVDVYDANDKLLGQKYASFVPSPEAPEWMTENFVNFSGTVEFSKPTTETGYILFKKDNPSDLRELDEEFKLPVNFQIADANNSQTKANRCREESNTSAPGQLGMANPASKFCVCMGGENVIVTNPDGSQGGTCKIGGKTHDEWEYYRSISPSSNL